MHADRLDLGDTIYFKCLSYSQITSQTPSIQEVSKLLSSYNFRQVLITLIRIGLAFSRSENADQQRQSESILKEAFCSPSYTLQIESQGINQGFIFSRFAMLRLLLESCRISQSNSSRNVVEADERHDLGECFLMMNDFLVPEAEQIPLFSLSLDLSELNQSQTTPEELRIGSEDNVLVPQSPLCEFLINRFEDIRSAVAGRQWPPIEHENRLYTVIRAEGNIEIFDAVEERNHLLVQQIPYFEYANKYHNIRDKMVRSKELLNLAQDSAIDIQAEFSQATGFELETYQYLIFYALCNYLDLTRDEVLHGENLFISTPPQHLEDIYDKLLKLDCVSIDELPNEIYNSLISTPMNEFHVFRDKPLIKTAENEIICVDLNFLADKLESGVFWFIFKQLKQPERAKLFSLWGRAFENYVGSILKRCMPNADSETDDSMEVAEKLILSPRYKENPSDECIDFIIHSNETLILMECKVARLTADAKYNGKFHDLERELKEKCVTGIEQLRTAILKLANQNQGDRKHIEGVNLSQIGKIYPVLIVLEETFSTQWMNWYLDRQLRLILKPDSIRSDLQVAPLCVLKSSDLEHLEPYLTDTPFHVHLENWLELYRQNYKILSFRSYIHRLRSEETRRNQYIKQKFDQFGSEMVEFFSQHGVQ